MWKFALLFFASLTPALAIACPTPMTYDFADPHALPRKDGARFEYFIGRVIDVKAAGNDLPAGEVPISFEVLRDYRQGPADSAVSALAGVSRCVWTPEVGYVGKFAIDKRGGQPWRLVATQWAF